MQPLKITAHLVDGFVASDKWSPSIDGILAYQHVMAKLGSDRFAAEQGDNANMTPVDDLPVKIISHEGAWWYACSLPLYESSARLQKHFHRRFDQQHSDYIDFAKKSGNVLVKAGPYKNYRRAIYKTLAPSISWHVIGDVELIQPLLDKTTHVGSKCSQGYGEVSGWSVEDGIGDMAMRHRALPKAYAGELGVEGINMSWGLRPPARLPENQFMCVMPA